jgi:hypothetical protein
MDVLDPNEKINIDSGVPTTPPEEFRDAPGAPDIKDVVTDTASSPSSIPAYLQPASQETFDKARETATGIQQGKIDADKIINGQLNDRYKSFREEQKRNLEAESHLASQISKPWDAKAETEAHTTPPMEKFGNAAMIFAGIASAFSKTPAISALNAGAAVLNAINTNDAEGYKRAYTAWKDNTDLAVKRFNMQRDIYADTNQLFDKDINMWKIKLTENATRFGDLQTLNLLQHNQYPQFFEAEKIRADAMEKAIEGADHMKAFELRRQQQEASFPLIDQEIPMRQLGPGEKPTREDMKTQELNIAAKRAQQTVIVSPEGSIPALVARMKLDMIKGEHRLPTAKEEAQFKAEAEQKIYSGNRYGATLMGAGYTPDQPLSPAREETAKMIATYKQAPPSSYAMGRPDNQELMARANVLSQEMNGEPYDAKKYKGLEGSAKTAGTADARALSNSLNKQIEMQTALESFEKTAVKNFDKLVELAKKVDKTGVPIIEKWIRAGRQATGDPDVSNFNLQWTLTTPEIARIITSPRLVGQLTDTARNEVHNAISSGASLKQLQYARDLLVGDFERRRQSTNEEIVTIRKQLKEGIKSGEPSDSDPLGIR